MTDLDDLHNDIASLASELAPPADPLLRKFAALLRVPALNPVLSAFNTTIPDLPVLTAQLDAGAEALIAAAGAQAPEAPGERLPTIARLLEERRSKTFPVGGFKYGHVSAWSDPAPSTWTVLNTYVRERATIDEEAGQLVALFDEALRLPAIAGATETVDCPLCETSGALTPERVAAIRSHVENTEGFKTAERGARSALAQLASLASGVATAARDVLPAVVQQAPSKRRAVGFTMPRLRALLDEKDENLVRPWLTSLKVLLRASRVARRASVAARAVVEVGKSTLSELDPAAIRTVFEALSSARQSLAVAVETYVGPAEALASALAAVIDRQSDTVGWQDFLDVAENPVALRNGLIGGLCTRVPEPLDFVGTLL